MAMEQETPDGSPGASGSLRERLARFVQRTRERAESARSGLTVHGVTYAAVNAFLLLINLVTSPGFLWCLFPLSAWGIGLLHHATEARVRAREARDAAALPPLTRGTLARIRKLFSLRRRLHHHLSTVAGLSAFLGGVNIFLAPGAPWSIFPMFALGVPLAIHHAVARTRRRRLRRELEEAGLEEEPTAVPRAGPRAECKRGLAGARAAAGGGGGAARDDPRRAAGGGRGGGALASSDLQPELDAYTEHIGALLQARRDLERAEARVSAAEVTQELAALRGKLKDATSPELRTEYETAVEQYEGQLRTLQDLQDRMEMIDLRAKSAVLALQQLSLDIPRLRAAPTGESSALLSLRDKAQELTHYLEDLRAGHRDLEQASIRGR